jgi:hypothetical protein
MHWENTDYPFYEHAIYFPECIYLNYVKGKQFVKDFQQTHLENNKRGAATTRLFFPM